MLNISITLQCKLLKNKKKKNTMSETNWFIKSWIDHHKYKVAVHLGPVLQDLTLLNVQFFPLHQSLFACAAWLLQPMICLDAMIVKNIKRFNNRSIYIPDIGLQQSMNEKLITFHIRCLCNSFWFLICSLQVPIASKWHEIQSNDWLKQIFH